MNNIFAELSRGKAYIPYPQSIYTNNILWDNVYAVGGRASGV